MAKRPEKKQEDMAKRPEKKQEDESSSVSRRDKLKAHLSGIKQEKVLANRSISSGSLFVDLNLNPKQPGFRCGKCQVIAGRPGAGKSSLALSTARALIESNKKLPEGADPAVVIYIDAENGMDDDLLHKYGFTKYNTPNFEYKLTNKGADILSMIEKIIIDYEGYEGVLLIIVDSVPHLSFVKDGETIDYNSTAAVAMGPNKLKVFFRENKNRLGNTNICLMMLTFMTSNIGANSPADPKYILSGGSFLEYGADVAIELTAKGQPRETEVPPPSDPNAKGAAKPKGLGKFQDVAMRFIKNKGAAKQPFYYTLCLVPDDEYKMGIQDLSLMVNYAVDKRVVELAGSWIKYEGKQWQGKAKFKEALKEAALAVKEGREPGDPEIKDLHLHLYRDVRARILKEHNIKE